MSDNKIKVLPIDFRPSGIPRWNCTDDLIDGYVISMAAASKEIIKYDMLQTIVVNDFPILENGDKYTVEHYNQVINKKQSPIMSNSQLATANYELIIKQFHLAEEVGKIFDEVWLFGGPYFGFYESRMIGKDAYWCNGPEIKIDCKRFVMMGFNYERSVTEMIHDFGHRVEDIVAKKTGCLYEMRKCRRLGPGIYGWPWKSFSRYLASQGTVHRVPGGAEYSQEQTVFEWLYGLKPEWWEMAARV